MIKAVLFDLDGTLYDRDTLATALFESQYDAFASELHGVTRERFLLDTHAMDGHGHNSKESGYRDLVKAWRLDAALAPRLVEHFWASYDGYCRLSDDTAFTLAELRRRGLKLGVVTNGGSLRQRRKLAALGLEAAFDTILVSEEEGISKPDAEIFRRALERCGVAAREALFVGDHPVADIEGAYRAGLQPVWKYVPYWPPVVPSAPAIDRLSAVLPLAIP